ncbi:MarR family transcriptional regulator [Aquibium sp. ELW1220]|uniref:MarR family winged helix-turn-helix transcriptional regulator n=1 Tax=Aquibium sp. ELW1220 TaxID=2976766 RepID=UPI0025B14D48|nr:MarR family transcriptional regulator [Aquibium sp. ELW1220]MDN2581987.1 MarR family transcriptional regulator [Aquibium sp. ELW1220]
MTARDIVRELGLLTLGTRMKRLGERLQSGTQAVMADAGISIPAAQFPLLAALDRLGPLAVGDLADALGVTQPGTTRNVAQLVALDLIEVLPAPDDQRRRMVSLSAKGRRLVETGKRDVWPRVEAAVAELCAGLDGPLLDQLTAVEERLAERPLERRAGTGRPEELRR